MSSYTSQGEQTFYTLYGCKSDDKWFPLGDRYRKLNWFQAYSAIKRYREMKAACLKEFLLKKIKIVAVTTKWVHTEEVHQTEEEEII